MKIIPGACFALLLSIASLHGNTQGSCAIPTIKIAFVAGQVVSKHEGVPSVTLQLRDWKDQTKTLMEGLTDDDGNFDLTNIKEGKYLLVVKRELYSSLYIPIRVEPGSKNRGKTVLVHLAPDYLDACAEGGVELKDAAVDGQSSSASAKEHFKRAEYYRARNDPRAEQEYRQAIAERGGNYADAWEELSRFLSERMRFAEAASAWRTYLEQEDPELRPTSPARWQRLERAAALKSRYDKGDVLSEEELLELVGFIEGWASRKDAVPFAENAVKLYPQSTKALLALAGLLRWEQKDRSLELLNQAAIFEPNDASIYLERGSCYQWGYFRPVEAEADYRRALEVSNGAAWSALAGRGDSLAMQGRPEEAIAAYQKYLSLRPPSADHYDFEIKKKILVNESRLPTSVAGNESPGVVSNTPASPPRTASPAPRAVTTDFTFAPSYWPDTTFNNGLYGEAWFGKTIGFNGPTNARGVAFIPFHRWHAAKGNEFQGWNQLQRGASPGADIGDFSILGFIDNQLSQRVNVTTSGSYILKSNPKSSTMADAVLLDRPDEFLAGVGFDFLINQHFNLVADAPSPKFLRSNAQGLFYNEPVETLDGFKGFPARWWGIGAAYRRHTNQQDWGYFEIGRPAVYKPAADPNGFVFQFWAGHRSPRIPSWPPNQPPTVSVSSSTSSITLPNPPGTNSSTCTAGASRTVVLTANAADSDNDVLLYTWSVTGGTLTGEGTRVTWDLSGVSAGSYEAIVAVNDGNGHTMSASVKVSVSVCHDIEDPTKNFR